MDNAQVIREAIQHVCMLREKVQTQQQLGMAFKWVKRIQSARFQACYADLLASCDFGAASHFFLEDLYGEADYSDRDMQFARIAGTLSSVFPSSVIGTATALARLHVLTEELDYLMAMECMGMHSLVSDNDMWCYVTAWRAVGRRSDRQHQLQAVLDMGHALADLTRKPGLSILLNLMRAPAARSGLSSLQQFLERGFKTFSALSHTKGKVDDFLSTIEYRESAWMNAMFDAPKKECLEQFMKPIE